MQLLRMKNHSIGKIPMYESDKYDTVWNGCKKPEGCLADVFGLRETIESLKCLSVTTRFNHMDLKIREGVRSAKYRHSHDFDVRYRIVFEKKIYDCVWMEWDLYLS